MMMRRERETGVSSSWMLRNASNAKYRVLLLWTSVLPRPDDLRDKRAVVPEPPSPAAEQVVEVYDAPWPTLKSE